MHHEWKENERHDLAAEKIRQPRNDELHRLYFERPKRDAVEHEVEEKADEVPEHEAQQKRPEHGQRRHVDVYHEQREGERRHDEQRVEEYFARSVCKKIERYDDRLHEVGRDASVVKLLVERARLIDVEHETHQEGDRRVSDDRMQRQPVRRDVARVERRPDHAQQIDAHHDRRDARENVEAVRRFARHRTLRELDVRLDAEGPANRDHACGTGTARV